MYGWSEHDTDVKMTAMEKKSFPLKGMSVNPPQGKKLVSHKLRRSSTESSNNFFHIGNIFSIPSVLPFLQVRSME